MPPSTDPKLVRISFELEPGAWHGSATERLWAEPLGEGRYRLRNTPFFAFGVSYGDIVFAEERDGAIVFAGISIRGGHSTYRIILRSSAALHDFFRYWKPLEDLRCSYEEGRVYAVDVPQSADIYAVYQLLEGGLAAGVWEFEEGHCGHPLRD